MNTMLFLEGGCILRCSLGVLSLAVNGNLKKRWLREWMVRVIANCKLSGNEETI